MCSLECEAAIKPSSIKMLVQESMHEILQKLEFCFMGHCALDLPFQANCLFWLYTDVNKQYQLKA